ncbi:hypothetical protein M885DRAFT_15418 [Pelagophyceae sp. CCMP2097]|nr:hypothetical protein M885DRAFT_15418 [Pelagophyceae sp. CCMP2097]
MVSVVLDSVEPATHVIAFTVVADRGSNDAVPVALGPRVEISFDAVLSDANVASNRYAPDASAPLAPRAAVPPRIAHDLIDVVPRIAHDLIDVVFVGSLKWDGQKTIWLQQLRGLDRARFRLCYVSFLGAADAEAGATFAAALEAAGVQLLLEPIPSIAVVELDAALGGGAALSETYDGEQATLDAYLLDRLAAAGNVVARVSPEWARRTWEHLVGVFRHVAPDVVVFANARDSSDSLLTAAARAGAPRAKLVMELPNLFPHAPAPACVRNLQTRKIAETRAASKGALYMHATREWPSDANNA